MKSIVTMLIVLLCLGKINSQSAYEICIENPELVNQNTFEFDICIKSTSEPFVLTSYQCAFTFHSKITNGGTLNFSYLSGSSELSNIPSSGIGIYNYDGTDKLTFASMPGNDNIDSSRKKIGRFRLQNSSSFSPYLTKIINPNWNFEGAITTILTGPSFDNITNPTNHISQMESFIKQPVITAFSSDTTNSNNHPGKSVDGLGYYDGDDLSYWRAEPTPQSITYDLGNISNVSLTRFSFYNFQSARKYIYSVQLSTDNEGWFEVVSYDTSDAIEYTENIFESHAARYVKLLLHSNNQNQIATVWEAEIWGGDQAVPVELNSFNCLIEDKNIVLNWITNSELNNNGFEIERKKDNDNFEKIGFAPGFGTTTETHNYSFKDENLNAGNYSYRLKQIDLNGTYEYSETIEAEIFTLAGDYQLYQNYPNPFNPTTIIKFSMPVEGKVKLAIFNILGEQVAELINDKISEGNHEIKFNGKNLASGIYVYRLDVENQFSDVRKMILVK